LAAPLEVSWNDLKPQLACRSDEIRIPADQAHCSLFGHSQKACEVQSVVGTKVHFIGQVASSAYQGRIDANLDDV